MTPHVEGQVDWDSPMWELLDMLSFVCMGRLVIRLKSGGWCCGQPHRAPGDVALLPNRKNCASYEQNLWLLWMSLNPINRCLVGGWKGDFFDLFFPPQ